MRKKSKRKDPPLRIIFIALAVISAIPFLPSLSNQFSVVDDAYYIRDNPYIQEITLANLAAIFTKPYLINYLPFHLLSYAVDHVFWGNNPFGYRMENILWHVGCVLIAFVILRRLLGRFEAAAVGALFFGAHPVCVESVAWIAERKNVMSQLFGLLSFWFYITRNEGRRRYLWSIIACFAALLSKTAVVVLPFLFMAHQWTLEGERNWKKLIIDKIPYFALSLATGLATVYVQHIDPSKGEVRGGGFFSTAFTMAVLWVRYVRMTLWPALLSGAYDVTKWRLSPTPILALACIASLLAVSFLWSGTRPALALGIFWFFIGFLPVSNIIPFPIGMKDRYVYLPLVGAAIVVGYIWKYAFDKREKPVRLLAAVMILCLMSLAARRSWLWRSPPALWEAAVRIAPANAESHANLSHAYLQEGRHLARMVEESGKTDAYNKNLPADRISVARLYLDTARPAEALVIARRLLPAFPGDTGLLATFGMAALQMGQKEAAHEYLRLAIERGSNEALPCLGMGMLAADRGNDDDAIKWLKMALKINPSQVDAHLKLAILLEKRDPAEALIHFQKVTVLAPNHPNINNIQAAIRRLKTEQP